MKTCTRCKHENLEDDARYCSTCGAPLSVREDASGATVAPNGKKRKRTWHLALIPINIGIMAAVFFMTGRGCSQVSGTFMSEGEPLGSFSFAPTQCRSGQRMNFFGVALLGEGQQDGALVAIIDPVRGKIVKVEIPGSCEPPEYEKCREVIIEPTQCSRYVVSVNRTSMRVNDITLLEGRLDLDCAFPGGGLAKGSIVFKRCN